MPQFDIITVNLLIITFFLVLVLYYIFLTTIFYPSYFEIKKYRFKNTCRKVFQKLSPKKFS